MTSPPKPFTEATLLRAMETAGRLVDDETLREALKENGIGRPSTRAAIIETLFKRNYIRKVRKSLVPTSTGTSLIHLIHEDLLKSAQLTGLWEKKLRDIEHHRYSAAQFVNEIKEMVQQIVDQVLRDNTNRHVAAPTENEQKPVKRAKTKEDAKPRKKREKKIKPDDSLIGQPCPVCRKGTILKGRSAYGCSEFRSGCTFRVPFATAKGTAKS